MNEWREGGGIPWVFRPRDEGADEATDIVGVALGRGYAHQSVATLGSAGAAGEVLRRELGRPVELVDGTVLEVRVQVSVGLQDTIILLQGAARALRERLARLDAVLRDPADLDLTSPMSPGEHPFDGWGRELAAWFGTGPAALSMDVDPRGQVADEILRETIRQLHPRRGTAAVGVTSVEAFVGTAFGRNGVPASPAPLRWRDRGRGSMVPSYANNLFSVRVPTTVVGMVAEDLLLATVHRALLVGGGTNGLNVRRCVVGGSRLTVVGAVPRGRDYDAVAVHTAVVGALEVCRTLSPEVVSAEIDDRTAAVQNVIDPVALAVSTLRAGSRVSPEQDPALLAVLTVQEVQRELIGVLDQLLLGMPVGAEAPAGFPAPASDSDPETRARPGWKGRLTIHSSRFPLPQPDGRPAMLRVMRHRDLLTVDRRTGGHGGGAGSTTGITVDLSRLVARIDYGPAGYTVLIDDADHRVSLPWPALRRSGTLRRAVDAATLPDRHLVLPADPVFEAALTSHRRRGRRVLIAVGVFLALVAGVIVLADVAGPDAGSDALPGLKTQVAFGTEVTLPNGTMVTVSNPRIVDVPPTSVTEVLAQVTFCGGGPSRGADGSGTARNVVDYYSFFLTGTATELVGVTPPDTPLLQSVTVPEGACTSGAVAFGVETGTRMTGLTVVFSNGAEDEIRWSG